MFIPRDDVDMALNQHQELLERSLQYPDQVTPLRTKVNQTQKIILAYAGQKMVAWGYQICRKSGTALEIPLRPPTYALRDEL